MKALSRIAFEALSIIGRPIGGIRPRRIYHKLARRGFRPDDFRWHRDQWGNELRLCPFYLLDRSVIAFGSYDPCLHRFLHTRIRPGMVCFDVGANIGEMTLHMARRTSPSGRVYAFEPVPGVFARLSENIARNGMAQTINASRIALSRENGTARMTFADETFENQGRGSIANVDQKELSGFGEVQTMRIDDFVERDGVDRIDLMKIDIQGAEPLLLEGGPKVFGAMGPDLLIEISPEDLAGLGRSSQDLVGLLRGFGYELFAMHNGDVADRLPQSVPPDFRADNIYCTKSRT